MYRLFVTNQRNMRQDRKPPQYSFLDNMGRRYIKLDIDIMTCNGMRYFTTFRYTAPVSFDLSMGGVWVTDLGGLPDSIFEKYPTLARRDDIRICLNDAKVVKHQNLIGNIKHHKYSNIGKK